MKKLFTLVITMLLGATLAFAQTGGGTDTKTPPPDTKSGKKATKTSKAHKGGKKGKKGSTSDTTPAPK